jgi:hypothetical protein
VSTSTHFFSSRLLFPCSSCHVARALLATILMFAYRSRLLRPCLVLHFFFIKLLSGQRRSAVVDRLLLLPPFCFSAPSSPSSYSPLPFRGPCWLLHHSDLHDGARPLMLKSAVCLLADHAVIKSSASFPMLTLRLHKCAPPSPTYLLWFVSLHLFYTFSLSSPLHVQFAAVFTWIAVFALARLSSNQPVRIHPRCHQLCRCLPSSFHIHPVLLLATHFLISS